MLFRSYISGVRKMKSVFFVQRKEKLQLATLFSIPIRTPERPFTGRSPGGTRTPAQKRRRSAKRRKHFFRNRIFSFFWGQKPQNRVRNLHRALPEHASRGVEFTTGPARTRCAGCGIYNGPLPKHALLGALVLV